jgi:hypothetical protein
MKKINLNDPKTLIQTAIGLGVLFVTVWIVGKAWKRSQSFSGAAGRKTPAIRGGGEFNCSQIKEYLDGNGEEWMYANMRQEYMWYLENCKHKVAKYKGNLASSFSSVDAYAHGESWD